MRVIDDLKAKQARYFESDGRRLDVVITPLGDKRWVSRVKRKTGAIDAGIARTVR